jgi:hypothetical protein
LGNGRRYGEHVDVMFVGDATRVIVVVPAPAWQEVIMIPTSAERVAQHTSGQSEQAIRREMQASVQYYAAHPKQIDQRLRELDEEWDVERMLELNSSALSLFGLVLGITGSRRWLLLPLVVQGFFLQHGLQGWCPPLPVFRRLGIRTQAEIEAERYALKAIRGDMADIRTDGDGSAALEAARR